MSEEIDSHGTGERGVFYFDKDGKLQKKPPKPKLPPMHYVQTDEFSEPIHCCCCDEPQWFTSKSRYKEHVKDRGYEITGFDHLKPGHEDKLKIDTKKELMQEDWEKSQALLKNGMLPMSADDRARMEAAVSEENRREELWKKRNWHRN